MRKKTLLLFVFSILFWGDVFAAPCPTSLTSSDDVDGNCSLVSGVSYDFNTASQPFFNGNAGSIPSNVTFTISGDIFGNMTLNGSIAFNTTTIPSSNATIRLNSNTITGQLILDRDIQIISHIIVGGIKGNKGTAPTWLSFTTLPLFGSATAGGAAIGTDITTFTNLSGYAKISSNSTGSSLPNLITITDAGGISKIIFQGNNNLSTGSIVHGLIGNSGSANGLGTLTDLIFIQNTISTTPGIEGGGIIGIERHDIGDITNLIISANTITSSSISGAGLLGAQNGSIGNLTNAIFSGNFLSFSAKLLGGGISGIYGVNTTPELYTFGDINNVVFSGNYVNSSTASGRAFDGGGIFGITTGDSNKQINVGDMIELKFYGNTIITKNEFWGGGIIGFSHNTSNSLNRTGSIINSVFDTNIVYISTNDKIINGGGIIGGINTIFGNIENVTFNQNRVNNYGTIYGGGVIGLYNSTLGTIGFSSTPTTIDNTKFTENEITLKNLNGGGIIGIYDAGNIGNIRADFIKNKIEITETIKGGGIIGGDGLGSSGVFGSIGGGDVLTMKNFKDNAIKAQKIDGGGIIGLNNYNSGSIMFANFEINKINAEIEGGGIIGISNRNQIATSIRDSIFKDNEINRVSGSITKGGGIIGYNAVNKTGIVGSQIIDNIFDKNIVGLVTEDIYGGGLIGLYDSKIISVASSTFKDNKVFANDLFGGGIIAATQNSVINSVSITDPFNNNVIDAKNLNGGGIIGVIDNSTITTITGDFLNTRVDIRNDNILGGRYYWRIWRLYCFQF